MADLRVRRERLLALLPRIFTAQPSSSAVGALIDSMAASLGRVDDTLTRIQYDRWVGLASAQLPAPDEASALEGLGRLLQVSRLPPRVRHAGYSRSPGEISEARPGADSKWCPPQWIAAAPRTGIWTR